MSIYAKKLPTLCLYLIRTSIVVVVKQKALFSGNKSTQDTCTLGVHCYSHAVNLRCPLRKDCSKQPSSPWIFNSSDMTRLGRLGRQIASAQSIKQEDVYRSIHILHVLHRAPLSLGICRWLVKISPTRTYWSSRVWILWMKRVQRGSIDRLYLTDDDWWRLLD